ncbi:uncharacterized protein J8A68_001480 [[Candida] subhashii]|uniref:Uncharacterized protein n=1 Tax=[Candida] subhashii TaxID=561895 RepID=A0A8J5UZT3_9ASCO|nr:uncharacterized protein J8A68_001480 [[Candida] subhashii]KAG7665015.1 hypothetical protein J8A68_001480 [[Candida] subhashii]
MMNNNDQKGWDTPFNPPSERYAIFGSVYKLIQFLHLNPGFIPKEISFDSLDDLILLSSFHDEILTRVGSIRICERRDGIQLSEEDRLKIKQIQSFPYNINTQSYIYDSGQYYCDDIYFTPHLKHLEIPTGRIQDPRSFFSRLCGLVSLSSDEFIYFNSGDLPPGLRYVSLTSLAFRHRNNFELIMPDSVTHLEIRNALPISTYLNMTNCKNVEYLQIINGKFKDMGYFIFPRKVVSLNLINCEIERFDDFRTNNEFVCLRSLKITGLFGKIFYYTFFNTEFPNSLVDLYFSNRFHPNNIDEESRVMVYRYPNSFDTNGIFRLDGRHQLPSNLKTLYLRCPGIRIENDWKVPQGIKKLELLRFQGRFNIRDFIHASQLENYRIDDIKLEIIH